MTETSTTPIPSKPDFAGEVARIAQKIKAVRDVLQVRGSYSFDLPRLLKRPSLVMTGGESEKSVATLEGTSIRVDRDFVLRGVDESDGAEIVEIRASFRLWYDLVEPESISEDVLQAAADLNSRFNLTAYWREYVHSCCSRSGLPPIQVAPFNGLRALKGLKPKQLPTG